MARSFVESYFSSRDTDACEQKIYLYVEDGGFGISIYTTRRLRIYIYIYRVYIVIVEQRACKLLLGRVYRFLWNVNKTDVKRMPPL